MGKKLKNTGLVGLGVVAGIAVSLQFSAMAQKPVEPVLPLEQLRQLADVYGLIKSDYVEPVDDKKLLTEAISGMVASLDPHSATSTKKPTPSCAKARRASSSAWASRSARARTATSRSSRRSRIRRPTAPASRRAT